MPAEPPYVDDATILDDTVLWRRIPKGQYVPDPKADTGLRPSSGAFNDSSDGPCQRPSPAMRAILKVP